MSKKRCGAVTVSQRNTVTTIRPKKYLCFQFVYDKNIAKGFLFFIIIYFCKDCCVLDKSLNCVFIVKINKVLALQ